MKRDSRDPKNHAVVVVNDDVTQLHLLSNLLEKDGLTAHPYHDAESALGTMDAVNPPDLIVTDLHMTGIDGWRFCRLLRSPEYEVFNRTPILLLSATFSGEDSQRITSGLGANAFIPAPVDARRFLQQVRSLLAEDRPPSKPHVLIIEDDREVAQLLKIAFEKHGYRASVAFDGTQGIGLFREQASQIAILDYHLPDIRGDELIEKMNRLSPQCVFVMITADTQPELAAAWLRKGADAYVLKPFDPKYLVSLCEKALHECFLLRVEDILEDRTRELRESETRYRTLFEGAPDGVMVHDKDGVILDCNEVFADRIGLQRGNLAGRNVRDVITSKNTSLVDERIKRVLSGGLHSFETTYVSCTGKPMPAEVNEHVISLRGSEVILSVSRDITMRKKAERAVANATKLDKTRIKEVETAYHELKKSQLAALDLMEELKEEIAEHRKTEEDLKESNRRLKKALEELEQTQKQIIQHERLNALGQMVAGVTHDFNNALMPIVGLSEYLLTNLKELKDTEETGQILENIHAAGVDAKEIVRRLREFYNPDEALEAQPVDICEVLTQVIDITRPKWKTQSEESGKTITIVNKIERLPIITANRSQLREVFANVLMNAVDAMPRGGTLRFSGSHTGKWVLINIADTGEGMPEEIRRRCFEPFFSTKGDSGTGLGLSMAHGIIDRHGGSISVESKQGKGTSVSIRMPLGVPRRKSGDKKKVRRTARKKLRILAIDDEEWSRALLSKYLSDDGHSVQTAVSGQESLEKVRSEGFDLVITDKAMPGMNGEQVAAAIKEYAPEIPVILLTGSLMMDTENKPDGVDMIISKPLTQRELREAVHGTVG